MKSKLKYLTGIVCAVSLGCLMAAQAVAQDDIQQRFDDAIQAIDDDRLRTARRTLEDLLAEHPYLKRVRLELARVAYMTYDYDEAERLAQQVLDDPDTPPAVQTTVLAFLAQIREDKKLMIKRHSWTPSIYVGTLYDTLGSRHQPGNRAYLQPGQNIRCRRKYWIFRLAKSGQRLLPAVFF